MRPTSPAVDHANRPRVLLVEPDEQTRVLLGQLLVSEGCELVALAPNYAQALVAARRDCPTVIVTELYAGTILSPQQYIEGLRRHSCAPVIVHSSDVPSDLEIRVWGLWGAVAKDAKPGTLLRMVTRAHAVMR